MKNVNNFLIAIMFREPLQEGFSFFELTYEFKKEFEDIFKNIEPTPVLSGGQNAPPEVPRFILKKDGKEFFEFTFSGLRFDFRFNNLQGFSTKRISDALKSIQSILNDFNLTPFRLGVVITGNIISEDSFFLGKYLQMDELQEAKEIQLSSRNMLIEDGHNLNEWIRYSALTDYNITNYEYDINTMNNLPVAKIDELGEIVSHKLGDFIEQ